MQYPFRKTSHGVVYAIVAILVMLLLSRFKINMFLKILITLLFCIVYAITDEYHQLHVDGRTGQMSDVIIDTYGAMIGISIYLILRGIKLMLKKLIKRIRNKSKEKNENKEMRNKKDEEIV